MRAGFRPGTAAWAALRTAALAGAACCVCLSHVPAARADADGELRHDVIFSAYSELSGNAELVRRLMSPLAAARLARKLASSGAELSGQPIDLAQERFALYVPERHSAQGYGLLVFVPPWQEAGLPHGWAGVLARYGFIFVSAARSGNDESMLGRRAPLALLAAQNVMRRYPVDPQRVYIAGFSGGSRVALRLALGYPDLFRAGILNAGSDPIGTAAVPLPPRELLLEFQSSTRLIYVSGDRDVQRDNNDRESMHSMQQWCVFGVDSFAEPAAGHQVATPAALARALGELGGGAPPGAARLAACRSAIDASLEAGLRSVESLSAAGHAAQALQKLQEIDDRFGGLAAPRIVELAAGS